MQNLRRTSEKWTNISLSMKNITKALEQQWHKATPRRKEECTTNPLMLRKERAWQHHKVMAPTIVKEERMWSSTTISVNRKKIHLKRLRFNSLRATTIHLSWLRRIRSTIIKALSKRMLHLLVQKFRLKIIMLPLKVQWCCLGTNWWVDTGKKVQLLKRRLPRNNLPRNLKLLECGKLPSRRSLTNKN